jgi:aminoglycoside phosphotransferase (APT) family kinase protein
VVTKNRSVTGSSPEGVDLARVSKWFDSNITEAQGPLSVSLISGGRSNLTYLVKDVNGRPFVLRRPPLGNVLSTAHDMSREHRIIAALADTDVPVAGAFGLCTDLAVNDAPFYVMEYVPGVVLNTVDDARAYPEASRAAAAGEFIGVLGRLHAVDIDAVGLGTLGRREGYIERQLRRWSTQWQQSKTRELPAIEEVHRRLASAIPPQRSTGIVHGDYRLGNMLLGPSGELRAVLDWELATLGDTLADLGWLISSWAEPGEATNGPSAPPTTAPGFPSRGEMAERYHQATGRDLSDLPYYVAFARWRSACIGEGVLARYVAQVMGDLDFDIEQQARSVAAQADAAKDALDEWQSPRHYPPKGRASP